ncbi:MAG: hypothetical protein ACJAUQ_000329 [Maribacter sp.]|jgi:hypothetical protein
MLHDLTILNSFYSTRLKISNINGAQKLKKPVIKRALLSKKTN